MNIVLEYDPVTPHAALEQNGVAGSELFGPLSNVRGYPIQSWLEKRGAWPGLAKVLSDIGRGRALNFTFIGRRTDYRDVAGALSGMKEVSVSFQNAHEIPPVDRALPDLVKRLMDDHPSASVRCQMSELLAAPAPAEYIRIDAEEDYRRYESALENTRTVILMSPAVFRAVRTDLTSRLHEHFMRPCESIAVTAADSREQSALTEEFGGMGITFCTESDPLIPQLIEKHSLPELARFYATLYGQLIPVFSGPDNQIALLTEENRLLRRQNLEGNQADELKYSENLAKIKWIKAHSPQISELYRRLSAAHQR